MALPLTVPISKYNCTLKMHSQVLHTICVKKMVGEEVCLELQGEILWETEEELLTRTEGTYIPFSSEASNSTANQDQPVQL